MDPSTLPNTPAAVTLDRRRFNRLSELVTRELGIRMPPTKLTMLQSRLQRRMRELQMTSLDDYEAYLFGEGSGSGELIHFFDIVTTNKTDFFSRAAALRLSGQESASNDGGRAPARRAMEF